MGRAYVIKPVVPPARQSCLQEALGPEYIRLEARNDMANHTRASSFLPLLLGMVFAILLCQSPAYGLLDKDNQGRWNKPTESDAPDKEVPGFLVNLGPTGARAILTEKTFIVKYIFKGSPAADRLKIDDVILGVFGKPFSSHKFGGGPHGYEGPIMDMGLAIEKTEAKDGKLVLNVNRDSKTIEVKIDLEPIGAFSPTFPLLCKKSELLRARALKYLVDHPDSQRTMSHTRCAVALAMLASENPSQQAIGKSIALKWSGETPNSGTWTWHLSYQLITLSEYYLLSRDSSVLPAIKTAVSFLEKAQYSGRIMVWGPKGDKSLEKEDYAKVDALQQLYDGGFGHGPYTPGYSKPDGGYGPNGYGPMQITTLLAITGWQLAARCGVNPNPDSIKRAMDFHHRCVNAAGAVGYGGEFCLAFGIHDPAAYKRSTGGDNYVGRVGAAIITHRLSPEFPESAEYLSKFRHYFGQAYRSLPDGHGEPNLAIFWGLMGAEASGDDKVLRTMMDYHKAYFNMARCHDGSFVLLPGRDYADNGYYGNSRYHPTATMALVLGMSYPKLRIQGIEVGIPGVNPKALKGKMDAAYKAIVKKTYKAAYLNLIKPKPEDEETAKAMMAYVDTKWQAGIAELEAVEKSGDILSLANEAAKQRTMFKGIEGFDQKMKRFDEGLDKDPWRKEISLGKAYLSYLGVLKKYKSKTSAKGMEKFAQDNSTSIYAKWASAVLKEFRESGTISVSASGKPFDLMAPNPADTNPNATGANSAP